MDEVRIRRRERRRRKVEKMAEADEPVREFEKTIENVEFSIKPHVTQSLGKLIRRDTYTVLHSKTDMDLDLADEDELNHESSSNESKNHTYSLDKNPEGSNCDTYNVDDSLGNSPEMAFDGRTFVQNGVATVLGEGETRPVPAPRRCKSINSELEKISIDTDRDVTEIDLEDFRVKSPPSDVKSKPVANSSESESGKSEEIVAPVPKPRKTVTRLQKADSSMGKEKPGRLESSDESLHSKSEDLEGKSAKLKVEGDSKPEGLPNEVPLIRNLQIDSDEMKKKSKKQKKSIGELFDLKRKKKKSKTLSSLMKMEKKKLPKISSILKDLKEEENKDFKADVEEFKTEFEIDSPHYTESSENGQIYVQSKTGFRVMERNEILRNGNRKKESEENGGMMENSTVKTALLFQKYWSRSMIYFHGVLAGFGFSHAATVTAIMLHYNYGPQEFIAVYSCLSLKIHYAFYILTALSIISCFDRVDIGHMNRRHWQTVWKFPSMWIILFIYMVSFVLTFSNQITEARFDAHSTANMSELWRTESQSDIQVGLLQWYHTTLTRDMLVVIAWLCISLSKYSDFLHSHIKNMAKYSETKDTERGLHHGAGPKGDYF